MNRFYLKVLSTECWHQLHLSGWNRKRKLRSESCTHLGETLEAIPERCRFGELCENPIIIIEIREVCPETDNVKNRSSDIYLFNGK